jgi:hypothetical protein
VTSSEVLFLDFGLGLGDQASALTPARWPRSVRMCLKEASSVLLVGDVAEAGTV